MLRKTSHKMGDREAFAAAKAGDFMVVNNKEKLFHIGISPSDGAPLALICGDPGRVCHIAALCEEPSPLASNREYTSYSAKIDGKG